MNAMRIFWGHWPSCLNSITCPRCYESFSDFTFWKVFQPIMLVLLDMNATPMRPSAQIPLKSSSICPQTVASRRARIQPPLFSFVCNTSMWWYSMTTRTKFMKSQGHSNISLINEYDMWSQRYFPDIISWNGRISFRPRPQQDQSAKIRTESQNSLSPRHHPKFPSQDTTSPITLAIHLLFSRWDLLPLLYTSMSFETPNQMTPLSRPSWSQRLEASFHGRNPSSLSRVNLMSSSPSSLVCP